MAVPKSLLTLTNNKAVGFCIYGKGGQRKTFGVHTLPYPIEFHDFEGGSTPIMPWIRRSRDWNETTWINHSQQDRERALSLVSTENRDYLMGEHGPRIPPMGLIDVVYYDVMNLTSYDNFVANITNFDYAKYNSIAIDSLHEFSMDTQTYSKGKVGWLNTDVMHVKLWAPAQERAGVQLRLLKNYRDKGVFVYMTGSEFIDKDYVNDPRDQNNPRDQNHSGKEQAYSVAGTVKVPGQLVAVVQHITDIMLRARTMGDRPTWVLKQEPLPSGAYWETKDRTGRLKFPYHEPNVRRLIDQIYGEELRKEIYASGKQHLEV